MKKRKLREELHSKNLELASNLVLFYLLERVCAGFLNWVIDADVPFLEKSLPLNKSLKEFLNDTKDKMNKNRLARDQRNNFEIGEDPFDEGFMLSDLSEYIRKHTDPRDLIFGGKTSPSVLFGRIDKLKIQRNKLMHGLAYVPDTNDTAKTIFAMFNELRLAFEPYLLNICKPFRRELRDHTLWARMLYLSEKELLWISGGKRLPKVVEPAEASYKILLDRDGSWQEIVLTATDRDPDALTAISGRARDRRIWVSDDHYESAWLENSYHDVKAQMRAKTGLSAAALKVNVLPIGPVERGDDWFNAPWWRKAPDGKRHLWVTALD
jgi:hypothetical protein